MAPQALPGCFILAHRFYSAMYSTTTHIIRDLTGPFNCSSAATDGERNLTA